jgi:2-polyprenyl-3-methyl-5-hydroxy-6-metoxy-1,4-benzoquinol methylase
LAVSATVLQCGVKMKVRKKVLSQYSARIDVTGQDEEIIFSLEENSMLVDGIGGVLWDGSITIINLLQAFEIKGKRIVEFGCGIGICGIYAAFKGAHVVLTDREVDLVAQNVEAVSLPSESNVTCHALTWGDETSLQTQNFDIILVCECACLVKQQEKLVQSIADLTGDGTVVIVTFDGKPPPNDVQYEIKFAKLMNARGFFSQYIDHSRVDWSEELGGAGEERSKTTTAQVHQLGPQLQNRSTSPSSTSIRIKESTEHHIIAYYRPTATKTCCRCHSQYLELINAQSCTFHPGYYVCRKHPGETRLSIDGNGDSLGYYGNGQEGWPAKFWDCCGSEDPSCAGCCVGYHLPYSCE